MSFSSSQLKSPLTSAAYNQQVPLSMPDAQLTTLQDAIALALEARRLLRGTAACECVTNPSVARALDLLTQRLGLLRRDLVAGTEVHGRLPTSDETE
jgi:hypothetical protein